VRGAGALLRACPLQRVRPHSQGSDPAEPRASLLERNSKRLAIPRRVSNDRTSCVTLACAGHRWSAAPSLAPATRALDQEDGQNPGPRERCSEPCKGEGRGGVAPSLPPATGAPPQPNLRPRGAACEPPGAQQQALGHSAMRLERSNELCDVGMRRAPLERSSEQAIIRTVNELCPQASGTKSSQSLRANNFKATHLGRVERCPQTPRAQSSTMPSLLLGPAASPQPDLRPRGPSRKRAGLHKSTLCARQSQSSVRLRRLQAHHMLRGNTRAEQLQLLQARGRFG
jgi:hypothetical protein